MKKLFKLSFCFSTFCYATVIFSAPSVTSDTSWGRTAQDFSGNFYIEQALGNTQGSNLFHSFSKFDLSAGESATFTGDAALKNVITRVTGGASTIDGRLISTIGTANFYFINPAGVTFGVNAQVDVPATFHVSTADAIRFADGSSFYADPNNTASTLTVADPVSFGFLGNSSNSTITIAQTDLSTLKSTKFDLIANNISISSSNIPAKEVRVVAVKGTANISIPSDANPMLLPTATPSSNTAGTITIDNSSLRSQADGGTRIALWGNEINIKDQTVLRTRNNGATPASATNGIEIQANLLNILGDSSKNATQLTSETTQQGNAGVISINSNTLNILDGATILSRTLSDGNAGSINIKSGAITVRSSATITDPTNNNSSLAGASSIINATYGAGKAGDINILANNLNINGQGNADLPSNAKFRFTGISSESGYYLLKQGYGDSGTVTIAVNDSLNIQNGGAIRASTFTDGDAGGLNISANSLKIDGQNNASVLTGISSRANWTSSNWANGNGVKTIGNAGTISVNTGSLEVSNLGQISTNTTSTGNAGTIDVTANNILLDGKNNPDNKNFPTGITANVQLPLAATNAPVTGNSGRVSVTAQNNLTVINGSQISSSTQSSGKAGDVSVTTSNLSLDNNAEISAKAGTTSTGQTGKVNVTANNAYIANNAKVSVQNDGTATAPNTITPGTLNLTTSNLTMNRGFITAATSKNVNAGTVTVNASNIITASNTASINSSTSGSGNAGSVIVTAPTINIDNSSITAKTTATGSAGTVTVNAGNTLTETNNATINSSTSGAGSAGSVNVSAPVISLDNANISAAANAGSSGQTGNVTVTASGAVNLNSNAKITVQNDATVANPDTITPTKITVTAPNITLTNSRITTAATGNIKASDIEVNFTDRLMLDPSYILTTANTGDGGNIYINGGKLIYLQDSAFLTSVSGANSNGGNIYVNADFLVMETAAIQANAIGGFGGDIFINLKGLIPSYGKLILAGTWVDWFPFVPGFNVIQAASERGVSGNINLTSPQFDISGSLSGLDSSSLVLPVINRSLCDSSANSSLAAKSKGGTPITDENAVFFPFAVISGQQAENSQLQSINYSLSSSSLNSNDGCLISAK